MRWKNFGETTTEEGRKVFFSGKEDKHEHDVGFLLHKDIVNAVMGCRPVSSRLITIRLREAPFNITIGTWNTRTLRAAGKLQELTHEMDRYRWNILGLCEMR